MKHFLNTLVFIAMILQASAQAENTPKPIWKFSLDVKTWKVGHHQNTPEQAVIEHIKKDEKIDDWSVLVTELFVSGNYSKAQFDLFIEYNKNALSKDSKDFKWNIIEQSEKEITFEWSHQGSGAYPPQHEIKRARMDDKGFY